VIYLQRQSKDGDWNTGAVQRINASSAYSFSWRFGAPGAHTFRTLVPGGPENVAGVSPPVTVTATLPLSVGSLPPAS